MTKRNKSSKFATKALFFVIPLSCLLITGGCGDSSEKNYQQSVREEQLKQERAATRIYEAEAKQAEWENSTTQKALRGAATVIHGN